jgi:transglutaminase-like putative cysteine protease
LKLLAIPLLLVVSLSLAAEPRERKFKIDYSVSVDKMPTLTDLVELWLPIPHNDAHQTISKLNIESQYPYKFEKGDFGNRILHLRIVKPLENSFLLDVQFVVQRKEHLRAADDRDPNLQRWLQPGRSVPLDSEIREEARKVVQGAGAQTDREKARAVYIHIVDTAVKYDQRNDLFIAYARALEIPARSSAGLSLPADHGEGTIRDCHCWAEFYSKGVGWIPVDVSAAAIDPARREYFFGAHDENRVEFSRGRDLILTPRQQGEPLNFFIYPYVEVDGKPYGKVTHTIRYSDSAR